MLLIHILIALASLTASTVSLLAPTKTKLFVSKWLIAGTLSSGAALAISNHQQLLHVCTSGLAYTLVVTGLAYAANRRLAANRA